MDGSKMEPMETSPSPAAKTITLKTQVKAESEPTVAPVAPVEEKIEIPPPVTPIVTEVPNGASKPTYTSKRQLELDAYTSVLTAFYAKGELTWKKDLILKELRSSLDITESRHEAEILRLSQDEELKALGKHEEDFSKSKLFSQGAIEVAPRRDLAPLAQPVIAPSVPVVAAEEPQDYSYVQPVVLGKDDMPYEEPQRKKRRRKSNTGRAGKAKRTRTESVKKSNGVMADDSDDYNPMNETTSPYLAGGVEASEHEMRARMQQLLLKKRELLLQRKRELEAEAEKQRMDNGSEASVYDDY